MKMKTPSRENRKQAALTCAALAFLGASLPGTTAFVGDGAAVALAKWDEWSWGGAPSQSAAGEAGSQGSAQTLGNDGTTAFTSTEVSTEILAGFDNPPGGFLGDPDSFYVHNGAFAWSVDAELDAPVDFLRISYSLAGSEFGGTDPFPDPPAIDIASTEIDSRSYVDATEGNPVFYTDFELTGPADAFVANFGDNPIPNTSFRSVDAIQVEAFTDTAPTPVPEPAFFVGAAGSAALASVLLRRRTRRR